MTKPEVLFIVGKTIRINDGIAVSGSHYFRSNMIGKVISIELNYSGLDFDGKPERIYKLKIDFKEFIDANLSFEDKELNQYAQIDRDNGVTHIYIREENIINPDKVIYTMVSLDGDSEEHANLTQEFLTSGDNDYIRWLEDKLIYTRISRDKFADTVYELTK